MKVEDIIVEDIIVVLPTPNYNCSGLGEGSGFVANKVLEVSKVICYNSNTSMEYNVCFFHKHVHGIRTEGYGSNIRKATSKEILKYKNLKGPYYINPNSKIIELTL